MKVCSKCGEEKSLSDYNNCSYSKDNKSNICKKCINYSQRLLRHSNNNLNTYNYEKTINGFLMRLYRNMNSRINGIQKKKFHLYKGKELLDKTLFYNWSKDNTIFLKLFEEWEKSNYKRKLTPSVDRIDSSKGYFLENMEWVTHSENSRRGTLSKLNKLRLCKE
jgi:hypothetical protein